MGAHMYRALNHAIRAIALVRMCGCPRARAYVARRIYRHLSAATAKLGADGI
jgi:hypothetical protein